MSDNTPARLLLVDDNEIEREGLRAAFARITGFEVVGEADSVESAIEETRRLGPDVVLMDLKLREGSGVDACREILNPRPETRVVFLTSYHDDEAVLSAVFAGAQGYLIKEIGADVLTNAVQAVMKGNSILDPLAAKVLALANAADLLVPSVPRSWSIKRPDNGTHLLGCS